MDSLQIRSYYRLFVRYGLRAVSYKAPHRYIYMDVLRRRFTSGNAAQVNIEVLERTAKFIQAASEFEGMENRIIKTLIHVEYGRRQAYARHEPPRKSTKKRSDRDYYDNTYNVYQDIVASLNRSAGLML
jgi:hypothetical protein